MQSDCLPQRVFSAFLATATLFVNGASLSAAEPTLGMIQLTLGGRRIEGTPISWSQSAVHLLGRDGRLWDFPPERVGDFKKSAAAFHAYSPSEFRAELLRELGGEYEVSGTGHYLVAHPRSRRDQWASRFEDLYRAFVHYFSVRGFQPVDPPYPLVAVVCRDRTDFARQSGGGNSAPPGVLGYYDLESNRINLYDMGGIANSDSWRQNAAVLIHEATHQTAFNTGVHSRWCPPPKWLAEGLATMFEAPGVYDLHSHPRQADRINREQLATFRQTKSRHRPEILKAVVADDGLFSHNPTSAYAEAWALSFFLSETQPSKYAAFLKRTAARPAFQEYTVAERMADFTSVFGADWQMLEAQLLRFIATLP